MKKIAILIASVLISLLSARAQETKIQSDSLVYRHVAQVDSALVGKSVFNLLSSHKSGQGTVSLHQSQAIINAMKQHIQSNPSRTISGYRVRIFFDNNQNARNASETAMVNFMGKHPGIPAYRSYQNPFFKVTVGDFRTKSEAMEFLQKVKGSFPGAFIVKENINFPAADKNHTYVVDTVTVFRPATGF